MAELWEVSGKQLKLHMHPGQLEAWDCQRRFVFVLAGTQSGKTSWGPVWLWREIQRTARDGAMNDYIVATSSFDLFKLKLLPTMLDFFEHTMRYGRYWAGGRVIELPNPEGKYLAKRADDNMWGRIVLRSASAKGGLESQTAKAAWLDECGQDEFTVEKWEAVLRRLSISQGRVLGTTTPYNLGWIKSEVYDKWQAGNPHFAVINFPSYLNPAFPREEYERAKANMPDWRFRMFYNGELARPAGLIYDSFDDLCVVNVPAHIPPHWERYVGIDFGATNTSLIWIYHDRDQARYVVYRESLRGSMSTDEHVQAALADAKGTNVLIWTGGAPGETQQRMDWQQAGVAVYQPQVSDVEGGISRVYGYFKSRQLFVSSECRGLLDELGSYKRKLDASGQPTDDIQDKRTFHRLDALRYAVSWLDGTEVQILPAIY